MSIPTKVLTITVYDAGGSPVEGAIVTAKLTSFDVYQNQYVLPVEEQDTTDASGVATLNLFPNTLGQKNTAYQVKATSADGGTTYINTSIVMPNLPKHLDELDGSSSATPDNTGISHGYTHVPFADQLGRFLSLIVNFNTAARQYTFPDKSGTVLVAGSSLTAGRVLFADADGAPTDDGGLTYNSATDTLATDTLSAVNAAISSALSAGSLAVVGGITAATLAVAGALTAGSFAVGAFSATTVTVTAQTQSGTFLSGQGSAAAPGYGVGETNTGFYSTDLLNNYLDVTLGGTRSHFFNPTTFGLFSDSASFEMGAALDVKLFRDAAAVLALRNGVNAQAFRVYNTFTDAANYERGSVGWNASVFEIAAEFAGTGSARVLRLRQNANAALSMSGGHVEVGANFDITFQTDNTKDIGASGANRPRDIYAAGIVSASGCSLAGASTQAGEFRLGAGASTQAVSIQNGVIGLSSDAQLVWSSGNVYSVIADVKLARDGVGILAQRNGANAQAFRVYNTFTDAANYERLALHIPFANEFGISTQGAGTGSQRPLNIDASQIKFRISGGQTWFIDTSGHLGAVDNTYDIGASGATRPRNIYTAGVIALPNGAVGTPAIAFADDLDTGIYSPADDFISLAAGGNQVLQVTTNRVSIVNDAYFFSLGASADVNVFRDAADVWAQRRGANAQAFRLYNTFTDAVNYERLRLLWSGNVCFISTDQAGTGTARSMAIGTSGSASLQLWVNAGTKWEVTSSGHFIAGADNTYDVGASGATRPRDLFLGRNAVIGGDLTVGGATMVQNSQSAAYTLVAADANKHILHPTADNNARTFTIPANSSVAFAIGTCVTFVNQINTVTISITTDTLVLAGAGTTGSRTLAANGVATAVKIAATTWMISGTGLT